MPYEILTPQQLIEGLTAGIHNNMPWITSRACGKRFTLSLINQLNHLIKLEDEYRELLAEQKKVRLDDMSSFVNRTDEPQPGDCATSDKFGSVVLIGEVQFAITSLDPIWVVEDENDELHMVRLSDLYDVGYYGD